MAYLGSWKIDDLLTFACNTHAASTGAATDADSVPSYRVYEDETGTAILTGSMAKLDDANTVGFYSEQITLSAANGFEKGKCYTVYISATVSSVTGTMHHTFQLEAEVDANTISSTGAALSAIPWNAAWDAEVESEVDDALGGGTGTALTAIPWNAAWDAEVESEVDDALGGGTGTALTAIPWNAAWDAEVESEATDALVAVNLDHLVGTATAIPAVPAGTYLDQIMDDGTAVYDRTTDSLQAIRDKETDIETDTQAIETDTQDIQTRLPAALVSGRMDSNMQAAANGVITAAVIATDAIDADAVATDAVTEIQSGLATASALTTVAGYLDTEIAAILADTNELQTDWANGGRLDLLIDAILADTGTDGVVLTAAAVDAILDDVVEGTLTMRQVLRILLAGVAGKSTGSGTATVTFRDVADAKARISASVSSGNRTAVTLDGA